MRIFFVSSDASGVSLCRKLHLEGHDVRLFIESKDSYVQRALDGIVKKIESLKEGIEWVGKDGLVVFDYTGYGELQEKLRKEGYSVIGGSKFGDLLEENRQYGQKILSACGMKVSPSLNFSSLREVIGYLEKNKGPWVIKQNGSSSKLLNYVGKFKDNRDMISLLKNYARRRFIQRENVSFDLQKRNDGVEVGVGRYFNGEKWVGPVELDIEHKDLMNDNLGPKTYEMGTLIWYADNEENILYKKTLAKIEPYLRKIDFRGDININCIVNEDKIYPLEATARFGYPALQLHMEIHESPWGEFLKALADGQNYDLKWKKGYGIVVLIAAPPFPFYKQGVRDFSLEGTTVHFKEDWSSEDEKHLHLEAIMRDKDGNLKICDDMGYILHVSGMGKTVSEARKDVYDRIKKIVIPKMYYRTDIGLKFLKEDEKKLQVWGYLK